MKTCNDCIHFTPCWKAKAVAVKQFEEKKGIETYCDDFLDRTRVIVLTTPRNQEEETKAR